MSNSNPTDTRSTASTPTTIAEQVTEFNEGFTAQIGPDFSKVFDDERSTLREAGVPDDAVRPGDTVVEATLLTPQGTEVSLAETVGEGPAVLVFYRGAWCPYCNLTLKTYQAELLPRLRERGVALVAISPQTPEGSEASVTNGSLEFPVLSDPGNVLSGALGIRTEPSADARTVHTQLGFDVADSNADATGDIPFPTVLVIDHDGVVVFADVHTDYTTRTEVDEIVAALDLLEARAA
ncbi:MULTISPECIES: peroxiredoxin-like family protein [unclassified Frigoribacterium]|uniref:peroxiredoxin-like family protein n=1 Tax=unclassified Frigoribacterium TaxID=2627005 RepID=UPI0006F2B269|nr:MULTISPECIES: peroxiredoxin-like family protein [unclassified Frigoribacterium]KQM29460.1 peroxiredoxin [Frigoribacterium sp. Leaf8]WAC52289.1 peroxiredoxin-like family protein [Frigoribacterium sp. SL97]